jgi:4-hydroxybenzoate polyprenyltransferase
VISLLASFGFLINDLWDRNVDKINHAGRFENSDRKTIALGCIASSGCLALGIGFALSFGWKETEIACGLAFGLACYSCFLRQYLITPTIFAGILAASPLWFPLILWPRNVHPMHWVFLVAMILLLAARETFMDVRDRNGDKVGARETVATVFGTRAAKSSALILLLGGAALTCSVMIAQMADLNFRNSLLAGFAVFVVLGFTIAPAYGVVRSEGESAGEHRAIVNFVLWSRAAMLILPLVNLFLWRS